MWIGASCSAIPPLMLRCGFGFTCFLTIITCSTRTRSLSGDNAQNAAALALVLAGDHLDRIVALNLDACHNC